MISTHDASFSKRLENRRRAAKKLLLDKLQPEADGHGSAVRGAAGHEGGRTERSAGHAPSSAHRRQASHRRRP
ncbi:hypothetical protein ACRAWD_31605 [Caulobacter segnis]